MGRSSSPGHSRAPVWVLQIVALAAHRSVPDGGDDDDVAGGHDDDDDVAEGQDDVSVAVLFSEQCSPV